MMQYYIRKNWKINAAAGLLIVLAAVLQVLASVLNMQIVNAMVAGEIQQLLYVTLRVIGLWFIIMLVIYARNVVRAKALETIHNHIRADLTAGIARLSPQQFRNEKTGSYLSWYTNDIQQLDTSCFTVFYNLIAQVTVLVAALAALIYLNILLAVICTAGAVLLLFVPKLFEKKANQAGEDLSSAQETFVKQIKSHLDGFYLLKIFDRIPYFTQLMGDSSGAVEQKKYQYTKFSGKMEAAFNLVSTVFQLGIFFLPSRAAWRRILFPA